MLLTAFVEETYPDDFDVLDKLFLMEMDLSTILHLMKLTTYLCNDIKK